MSVRWEDGDRIHDSGGCHSCCGRIASSEDVLGRRISTFSIDQGLGSTVAENWVSFFFSPLLDSFSPSPSLGRRGGLIYIYMYI